MRLRGRDARDDSVDVIDGEHDATDAERVHRRVHDPNLSFLSSLHC
jgi:hypothetical protein